MRITHLTGVVAATFMTAGVAQAAVIADAHTSGTATIGTDYVDAPDLMNGSYVELAGTLDFMWNPSAYAMVDSDTPLKLEGSGYLDGFIAPGSFEITASYDEALSYLTGLYTGLPVPFQMVIDDAIDYVMSNYDDIWDDMTGGTGESGYYMGVAWLSYDFDGFSGTGTDFSVDYTIVAATYADLGLGSGSADYELNLTLSTVPVPASLPLLIAGLGGIAALRRKKRAA